MNCCIGFCLVGAVLLGSMIMTMLASKKSKNFVHFMNILDDNQKKIYKSIIKERLYIYIQGIFIGILLGLLVSYKIKNKNCKICLFVAISLGFNYLYYSLYPKSTYMLQHLNTKEQNEAWLNIYKEMKFRCKIGLLLGFIGYIMLGMGLCK